MKRIFIGLFLLSAGFFAHSLVEVTAHGDLGPTVKRFASVIEVKPEMLDKYKRLHANPWPTVMEKLTECNVRNYSIYIREVAPGKHCLFSYLEYVGNDFDADMAKMADDPETQRWWKETDPCQQPIETAKEGEWWVSMEEVFHLD